MLNSFFEKFYWAVSVPISSFIGFLKLKNISKKLDFNEWEKSFSKKKVLIVGTGPSLDEVNDDYFLNFDAIVYINHAVKFSGKINEEYFFSTDVNVVKEINNKEYYNNIIKMGADKSILAPVFFQQALFLKKDFKNRFSWILASKAGYKLHRINKVFLGFRFPITAVFWPKQPDTNELDNWFSKKNQVDFFPVIESTSALSAILFAAKYKPKNISLIGCDFGMGRSKSIISDCPALEINVFSEAKNKFLFLKNYLSSKKILLENDSWAKGIH